MYILFPSEFESIFNMESLFGSRSEPEVKNIVRPRNPMDTWRITTREDVGEDEKDKSEAGDDIGNFLSHDDLWKIFFSESKDEGDQPKQNERKPVPIEEEEDEEEEEEEDEEEDEYPPYELMSRKNMIPESIFDHIEDFFPTKTDDANPVPNMNEQKNPFVFIANRLTFLIKTKHPIIFNTSMIESTDNYMDIAIDEKKTFPKLHNVNDVGIITNELNHDEELLSEIKEYLDGTEWKSIFCFPIIMNRGNENDTLAIRFVVTK